MAEVVCLGIVVADVYARPVTQWPEHGRLLVVDEMGIGLGGCAANTGLSLLKLGVNTAIIGKVGADGFGEYVINTLQEGGAAVEGVIRDTRPGTSATMIAIDPAGERTFLHYPGANGRLQLAEVNFDLITQARIFHCAGALVMPGFDGAPMAEALRRARAAGVITALDTVYNDDSGWLTTLEPCLRETDIFLPSIGEAEKLTGATDPEVMAERLLACGVKTVGIKMGEQGSYVRSADEAHWVPAYPIEALDGTGAGDAYVAGFLQGVLKGWPLLQTARFANAVGGLCATALGTTAGIRSFADTVAYLQQRDPANWA